VGAIPAAGLSPDEFSASIAAAYNAQYLKRAEVSLFVKERNSQKVFVLGQVSKPGPVAIAGRRITVIEAIAQAGGTSKLADASRVVRSIVRGVAHIHARGLLKQLLHVSTDAHIDTLGFGMGHVGLSATPIRAVRKKRLLVRRGGHTISLGCQESKLGHRHDLPYAGLVAIQVSKATARHRLQGARRMTRRLKLGSARRGLRVQPETKRLGHLEDSRKTWISLGAESPIQALAAESSIFGDL
jgi:hypothetical protein